MALAELAALSTALGAIKTISEIAKNVGSIELTQKIIELQSAMMEAQQSMMGLTNENAALKEQLKDREDLKLLEADMEYVADGEFYMRTSEKCLGVIAYCPICWKERHETIPMQKFHDMGAWRCSHHKVSYHSERYKQHINRPPPVMRSDFPSR